VTGLMLVFVFAQALVLSRYAEEQDVADRKSP
jgi:hypothetical protein